MLAEVYRYAKWRRKKTYLMNSHFVKINMCICSVLCQSCYVTVNKKKQGEKVRLYKPLQRIASTI